MIRKTGRKYTVYSDSKNPKTGQRRKMGTYPTKAQAQERLRQVEAAKHAKGGG
jgi:hypothetical protein